MPMVSDDRRSRSSAAAGVAAGVLWHPLGTPDHGAAGVDLLFRRFVGLCIDDTVLDQTTFGKIGDRLRGRSIIAEIFEFKDGQTV